MWRGFRAPRASVFSGHGGPLKSPPVTGAGPYNHEEFTLIKITTIIEKTSFGE